MFNTKTTTTAITAAVLVIAVTCSTTTIALTVGENAIRCGALSDDFAQLDHLTNTFVINKASYGARPSG